MSASSVPMSALERARAARDGYWWIILIALALSVVIARMSWNAYAATSGQDRATVCIVSQALAIALAIIARRALTANMPWAAVSAGALAAGCGWWASHGLALAWYGDAERNSEIMVLFMAILEPALFLLAEHVKEGQREYREAKAKEEAETAAELKRIRDREDRLLALRTQPAPAEPAPAPTPRGQKPTLVKSLKDGAKAASMAISMTGAALVPAHAQAATSAHGAAQGGPSRYQPAGPSTEQQRAEARRLAAEGLKAKPIHIKTGVSLTSCKRFVREARAA